MSKLSFMRFALCSFSGIYLPIHLNNIISQYTQPGVIHCCSGCNLHQEIQEQRPLETRMFKLGRKLEKPIFQHWAVQVRGKWYEIAGGSCSSRVHFGFVDDSNEINEGDLSFK